MAGVPIREALFALGPLNLYFKIMNINRQWETLIEVLL
jgi:hypothetical protein